MNDIVDHLIVDKKIMEFIDFKVSETMKRVGELEDIILSMLNKCNNNFSLIAKDIAYLQINNA